MAWKISASKVYPKDLYAESFERDVDCSYVPELGMVFCGATSVGDSYAKIWEYIKPTLTPEEVEEDNISLIFDRYTVQDAKLRSGVLHIVV